MDFRQVGIGFKQRVLPNKWFQAAWVAALVFVIYWATSTGSTAFDHYVRLSDAFLHGRLYIENAPSWLELARVDGRGYVMEPPAPTLFIIPWVAIWGLSTNQAIISMLLGAAAVGLFWVAATQLRWSLSFKAAVTVLVAFGTNFWWVTTEGSVWMIAHASAVFFLMAALVETTGKNRPWMVGLLVGLAGLSRLPTFLAFPFFAYTVCRGSGERWVIIRRLTIFGVALAVMGGLYLLYNYGQFGTLNPGYYRGQFLEGPWYSKGLFDISYIPRHIKAILFEAPKVTESFPFFKPSVIGMGLFFTTPALLYMFGARLKESLVLPAIAGLLLTSIPLVTYAVTGWAQFGYRFSLDVLPFMVILVASGMNHRLNKLNVAVILLSCVINLWGVLALHKFDWAA
ncbi:MAG: hypothetical protein FJ004_03935 [Chloroflexi bacterium]|nr:hypothetical protein [Chloroflexota bacterium]